MATVDLDQVPRWTEVRSETGLLAADNAVISLANYPLTKAFYNPEHAPEIALFWDAVTKTAGDLITIELLVAEPGAAGPADWIRAARAANVEARQVVILPSMRSSICYARVVSIAVNPATADLTIDAAYIS